MSSFLFSSSSWATTTSTGSLFPDLSTYGLKPIPDADFMLFHGIHRRLFSRLIFDLGREANESMLVLAFWMWLDIEGYCMKRLVKKLLWRLSPPELSLIANETLMCLLCIQTHEHENFMFSGNDEEIGHLQMLLEDKWLSLAFLHQDRVRILSNVMVLLNEVCWRAFKDILQGTFGDSFVSKNPKEGGSSSSRSTSTGIRTSMAPIIGMPSYPNVVPQLGFLEVPHFAPNEGGVGHGNEMGQAQFAPNEGGVGHGNGMGVSQFAPIKCGDRHGNETGMPHFTHIEGGVGHGKGMDTPQFAPIEGGIGHGVGIGMPQFAPVEGGVGDGDEMGMPHFVVNEGVGHHTGLGIPHFTPIEGGVGHRSGMGMTHFTPIEGGIGHGIGRGMPQFSPIEGNVGHGNGIDMPQFAPIEGGVRDGDEMGIQHFVVNEGVGHRSGLGIPHFAPIQVGIGHHSGMGMTQFSTIEGGVGHRNRRGMPQFAPIEDGIRHRNGTGMPQFAPTEGGVGHGDDMGMTHYVLNEGVGHMSGLGVPHFAPRESFGHGVNDVGMQHFVPNNGGVHGMGTMGVPGHVVVPRRHMMGYGPRMDLNALHELRDKENQHREFMARELELMMSHVHISEPREEQVPADDRTIFLTFSKGYPISEREVRIFFTRRYGNFIEDVFMQGVPRNEQPLYARVVARRLSDVKRILRGPDDKLKFAINGKHVWMRKYVKNNSNPRTPGRGGPVR